MSELTEIVLMLLVFAVGSTTIAPLLKRMSERRDAIVTGVINGVPIPMSYRRMLLFHDYVGAWFSFTFVLLGVGVGFLLLVGSVEGENARRAAQLLGGIACGGAAFNVLLFPLWMSHVLSVLRQDPRD